MKDEKEGNRQLRLICECLEFNSIDFDRPTKTLVLTWHAETEVPNMSYWRWVTLRLRWPPIRVIECFMDNREWLEGESDDDEREVI